MGFSSLGLDSSLLDNLKRLGYTTPTPVQREAIPAALAGGLYELWNDRARGDALGARAFDGVRAHYTIAHAADRQMQVYQALIST